MEKGTLVKLIAEQDPDILCLQETKCQGLKLKAIIDSFKNITAYSSIYCNCAHNKGYSGTMILSKTKPISVAYGLGVPELDTEGRLITLEYEKYILITCYTPNSKPKLARLKERTKKWEPILRNYIKNCFSKPVIYCGDLNVAHKDIDIARPDTNRRKAGFTVEERSALDDMLMENSFVDTFRHFYPNKQHAYTYWSNFAKSRHRNVGWRLDYFLVQNDLMRMVRDSTILKDYLGSDHAPIQLDLQPENIYTENL
jgi:exodeoxyribonuclease-3